MIAKDKADELYWSYYNSIEHHVLSGISHLISINCAVITVDQILSLDNLSVDEREYWKDVKNKLNLMQ